MAQNTSKRNLLIIAYFFQPTNVIASVRLFHFYRESKKYFDWITVISCSNRHLIKKDDSLKLKDVDLYEVPAFDWRRLILLKSEDNDPTFSSTLKKNSIVRWGRQLVEGFPLNIIIGDGGLFYILSIYRQACKIIRRNNITHIFSSYRPYSDHLIAHLLKRRFPHLFWIADFRDLHVDPLRKNVLWPAFQRWCNRRILRRADLVTTVSEGLKQHLKELAPRVYVLRNGMGAVTDRSVPVEESDQFTVVYTGALYEGQRDPAPLFIAISELVNKKCLDPSKISLMYAGPDGQAWLQSARQAGIEYAVSSLGVISRQEALQLQCRAHLNLLLTWASPGIGGVLTGKLFEYLQAGRPILALVNGSRDPELEEILGHWQENGVFYSEGPELPAMLEQFLLRHYRIWEGTEKEIIPLDRNYLEQFSWPHQMRKLMDVL